MGSEMCIRDSFNNSDNDPEEIKIAIDKFSEIIGSYILEDL